MRYTPEEVMQYVASEDVKFIRLAFCDVFGRQKNISIMPNQLERAFSEGIAFDASAVRGFGGEVFSDLFLKPDPSTLSVLTWRPEQGKVVRMYCCVYTPDGKEFSRDTRSIFMHSAEEVKALQGQLKIVLRARFHLYKEDSEGVMTAKPVDKAGSFDIAPLDGGENVRRAVCLTLERMGIATKASCHAESPGTHEISFYSRDILSAADDLLTFITVVKACANSYGLCADFSCEKGVCGFGIEISCNDDRLNKAFEGVSAHTEDILPFANTENTSHRIPEVRLTENTLRISLPEVEINPYLVFALLIKAAREGSENSSELVRNNIPKSIINAYRDR